MLKDATSIQELYDTVCEVYTEFVGEGWEVKLQEVGTLLWMQRTPEEQFDIKLWSESFYE